MELAAIDHVIGGGDAAGIVCGAECNQDRAVIAAVLLQIAAQVDGRDWRNVVEAQRTISGES